MPFEKLTPRAREALRKIEASSDIRLDFFAERIGLAPAQHRMADAPAIATPQSKATFILDEAKLEALSRRRYWRVKRAIDACGAAILLVLTVPAVLAISLVIAVGIGLPVAFWQVRPGHFGRPFKVYKLRTMSDAYDENRRRVPDELRHFGFGTFLRRTRLDELLQLYNILVGEMSFVGPRPLLPIDQPAGYAARLLVRPGLTGWAQVHGGRQVRAIDKAALDVWYVENASLWLDCRILALTVPMVLFGERANAKAIEKTWADLRDAGIWQGPMPPVDAR